MGNLPISLMAVLVLAAVPAALPLSATPAAAQSASSIVVEGNRRVEADTIRSYFKPGAGGRLDPMADRILDLARKHGVPIQRDPDLLATLEPLDVNSLIPPDLFQAVAVVLAALYRANKGPQG